MEGMKYLTANGKRVYRVYQQPFSDGEEDWKVVTVPIGQAEDLMPKYYSVQSRLGGFETRQEAQAALDQWAEAEGLFPYVKRPQRGGDCQGWAAADLKKEGGE